MDATGLPKGVIARLLQTGASCAGKRRGIKPLRFPMFFYLLLVNLWNDQRQWDVTLLGTAALR